STGHDTARVTVLRNAFGDPLALRDGSGAPNYGAPSTLASGAMEYPPTEANQAAPFGPAGGRVIFTFSDGTWVQVDAWMAQRFRAAFASQGPPPAPPSDPSVAWEVCAGFESDRAVRSGVWATTPERGVLRFYTGRDADAELLYRFATPELATRAESEQKTRCAQGLPRDPDKGIFSLSPPCRGLEGGKASGAFLRCPMRFATQNAWTAR